jgi:hypothetical protein
MAFGGFMRSDLVFGAMAYVPNRFLLTKLASKATRKLHKPGARIQDTANDVLARFRRANPMAVRQFAVRKEIEQLRRAS